MEQIKELPNWIKGGIGLITLIITFIALFQKNIYLSVTVTTAATLVAAFCCSLYVAFSKKRSDVWNGYTYRFPRRHRYWAFAVSVSVLILTVTFFVSRPSRSYVVTAFIGTATPTLTLNPTSTSTGTPTPTNTSTPTPTCTLTPTMTTIASPTATTTPTPTATDSPATTATNTPILITPTPPKILEASLIQGTISFEWDWERQLGSHEFFAVRLWPTGEPAQRHSLTWIKEHQYQLPVYNEAFPPGFYYWNVSVIRDLAPFSGKGNDGTWELITRTAPEIVEIPSK